MKLVRVFSVGLLTLVAACQTEQPSSPDAKAPDDTQAAQTPISPDAATTGQANAVTCSFPVQVDDSAQTLLARFEDEGRLEQVMGGEGELFEAFVLWPDDPARRLEVFFADEAMTQPASVRLADEVSEWTISGLTLGSSIEAVQRINGRAFELYGFGWDYGGTVFDWKGGGLGSITGGCSAGARIGTNDPDVVIPGELSGARALRSDLPALRNLNPAVFDLWIVFGNGRDPGT